MGGPRQVPPEGVEPESPAAAVEEEAGKPGLQIAGFDRDLISYPVAQKRTTSGNVPRGDEIRG